MSKLIIEVEDGRAKVFIDGVEIGKIFKKSTLIDSLNLSVTANAAIPQEPVRLEIVFGNMLGGLFEANHKEIIKSLKDSITAIRNVDDPNLLVDSSLRFQENTERLFEGRTH